MERGAGKGVHPLGAHGRRPQLIATGVAALGLVWLMMLPRAELAFAAQAEPPDPPTMSVCELFEDLLSHSGKMVAVRGRLVATRHGWSLFGDNCTTQFVYRGRGWPHGLDLWHAGSALVSPPVNFTIDRASIRRLDKLLCFLHDTMPEELGVEITVTFVGELRTIRDLEALAPQLSQASRPRGFGQSGAFPAQLIYRSAKDAVVRQIPVDGDRK